MELKEFLIQAKRHTYAGQESSDPGLLDDGAKEYTYQLEDFCYRDRYYGANPFVGEEIIWQGDRLVWAMNYYGRVFDLQVNPGDVYGFLQQALAGVNLHHPYRGPEHFVLGEYTYGDEYQGTIELFSGLETIEHRGREVYRLLYHGGKVG